METTEISYSKDQKPIHLYKGYRSSLTQPHQTGFVLSNRQLVPTSVYFTAVHSHVLQLFQSDCFQQ